MNFEGCRWPRAVVFDLDGTLIDSASDIANALNFALSKRGLEAFPVEEVKEMIGGGVPRLVESALLARGVSSFEMLPFASDFLKFYRANLTAHTTLFEGARELLERLRAEGRRVGLCTNKQHDLTLEALRRLDIAHLFDAVIGERPGSPRKPDPAPLREVLHALSVSRLEAVMVGDSPADVACARAAGVISVAVNFGYSRGAPGELGADATLGSLRELPGLLVRLCVSGASPESGADSVAAGYDRRHQ